MEKRCYGCMKVKGSTPICEHCGYSERNQNKPHQLPVGHVLQERYLIGRVLGQGGYGITYLGYDHVMEISVAIKEFFPSGSVSRERTCQVMNTSRGDLFERGIKRFLQEARILAKLHAVPEIVKVYNVFQSNGTAYIVMEYVEGLDLRTYLKRLGRLLTPEETLQMLRPVIRALDKIHSEGLIHRDISPDNIMLQQSGRVVLLDFGTALDVEHIGPDGQVTHTTQTILKHGFSPIEQYQSNGNLGAWTDVYAMCATIYYCMTGHVPPEAPARLLDKKELLWHRIPNLSSEYAAVFVHGMGLSEKKRFQTMKELERAIWKTPQPEPPPPSPQPNFWKKLKDIFSKCWNKKRLILIPVAVVLSVAVIWSLFVNREKHAETGKTVISSPTIPAKSADTKTSEVSTSNVLISNFSQSHSRLVQNTFGGNVPRRQIATITFLDSHSGAPADAWDASDTQNHSVLGWVKPNGTYYDLYLAAEGGIYAPKSCERLFAEFVNVTDIHFNGCFFTNEATDMGHMFSNLVKLDSLDLSCFDTSSVLKMDSMFLGCKMLNNLDLSNFDTSLVTHMNSMFRECNNLTEVNLGNWETGNVKDHSYFMTTTQIYNGDPWEELFESTIEEPSTTPATKEKYSTISVNWNWSDKKYSSDGRTVGYREGDPVKDCVSFDFLTTAEGKNGSKVSGKWIIILRINGKWKNVGSLQVDGTTGSTKLEFEEPVTFDAFTAYPAVRGSYSYSCNHFITNVKVLTGE